MEAESEVVNGIAQTAFNFNAGSAEVAAATVIAQVQSFVGEVSHHGITQQKEMMDVQGEIMRTQANVMTLKGGSAPGPLLISAATSTAVATVPGRGCHCERVDHLDGRVAVLDVAAAGAIQAVSRVDG